MTQEEAGQVLGTADRTFGRYATPPVLLNAGRSAVWCILALLATTAANACGDGATPPDLFPANQPPAAAGEVPDLEVNAGAKVVVEALSYFTDPDGDQLTYTAATSDSTVATTTVAGSIVTVAGISPGTATITVTATDPAGLSARQDFGVTVAGGTTPAATYRVVFTATWSSSTHPADFPGGAHFSSLIGSVHNDGAGFWAVGDTASPGIEVMAETGGTSTLAGEIESAGSGRVFAVVRGPGTGSPGHGTIDEITVREDFPLLTLVTMIAPSPDWFAGVAGLSLQDAGGNWVDELEVVLDPYDAGTDSGTTYRSADANTSPKQAIANIRGVHPFSDAPVGTFTFTRTGTSGPFR